VAALAGAAICLVGPLGNTPAGAADFQRDAFRTPAGDVTCEWITYASKSTLRCDQSGVSRPHPPRPKSCTLGDWGFGITLTRTGRPAFVCAGDNVADPSARKLRVGTSWRKGGFSCVSQRAGLRCANAAGHGFVVAPKRWQLF
jgi:hypothetical protein